MELYYNLKIDKIQSLKLYEKNIHHKDNKPVIKATFPLKL